MTDKRTAHAEHALPRPKDEPCTVCGRPYNQGSHYARAPKGLKCTAPGCKAPAFERCFGNHGELVATHCLGGGHRVVL